MFQDNYAQKKKKLVLKKKRLRDLNLQTRAARGLTSCNMETLYLECFQNCSLRADQSRKIIQSHLDLIDTSLCGFDSAVHTELSKSLCAFGASIDEVFTATKKDKQSQTINLAQWLIEAEGNFKIRFVDFIVKVRDLLCSTWFVRSDRNESVDIQCLLHLTRFMNDLIAQAEQVLKDLQNNSGADQSCSEDTLIMLLFGNINDNLLDDDLSETLYQFQTDVFKGDLAQTEKINNTAIQSLQEVMSYLKNKDSNTTLTLDTGGPNGLWVIKGDFIKGQLLLFDLTKLLTQCLQASTNNFDNLLIQTCMHLQKCCIEPQTKLLQDLAEKKVLLRQPRVPFLIDCKGNLPLEGFLTVNNVVQLIELFLNDQVEQDASKKTQEATYFEKLTALVCMLEYDTENSRVGINTLQNNSKLIFEATKARQILDRYKKKEVSTVSGTPKLKKRKTLLTLRTP